MTPVRITALFLVLTFSIAPARAQSKECLERTVPLSIISWDGSPLLNQGARSFDASVQWDSVEISSLALDEGPRRILLLIDTSTSFLDKSDLAIGLASDLVDHLPSSSEMGLASFSGSLTPLVSPTKDHAEILRGLQSVFPPVGSKSHIKRHGTALWDAVRNGVDLLGDSQVGDAVFVITDGMDTTSKEDSNHAISALLAKGIRLSAIEIAYPAGIRARMLSPKEGDPVDRMVYATDKTGGFAIFPSQNLADVPFKGKIPSELRKPLDLEYHLIVTFYRLDVKLSRAPERQLEWKLSLSDPRSSVRKNFELRYPKSFPPCN
jgi:hypothetical protein